MVEVVDEEMITTVEVEEDVLIQEVVEASNKFMTISLQAFTGWLVIRQSKLLATMRRGPYRF